eukprot:1195722-Prorocentrum_minimum.AAC.12
MRIYTRFLRLIGPCRALVRTAMRSEFSIHTNKSACATPARGSALRQRRTEPEAPKPYVKARSRSRPREKVAMARVASRCSDSKSGGWRVLYTPALLFVGYDWSINALTHYCHLIRFVCFNGPSRADNGEGARNTPDATSVRLLLFWRGEPEVGVPRCSVEPSAGS